MEKQILTNSSLTAFKVCPRKYEFQYELGYVPVHDSENLYFGKLIHLGLEEWGRNGKDIEKTLKKVEEEFNSQQCSDPYLLKKCLALILGYHEKYRNETYKIIFSEKEFRSPLLNPETAQASRIFEIGGIMDRIIQDNHGRYILLETKTTSEEIEDPSSDYWRKLGMDSQISTYYLGAEANGIKIETCLYDVIRKPTIRPKQVGKDIDPANPKREETPQEYYQRLIADIQERPNFYYARREVPRSKTDLEDYLFDTWHTAQTLRNYQLKKRFPRYTNACKSIFGVCPYFAVCTGQAAIKDPELFQKVENVHRELNLKKEAA